MSEKINVEGTIHELSESITNFRYLLFELVSANISYNIVMQSLIIPVEHFRGDIQNKVAFELYVTQRESIATLDILVIQALQLLLTIIQIWELQY